MRINWRASQRPYHRTYARKLDAVARERARNAPHEAVRRKTNPAYRRQLARERVANAY